MKIKEILELTKTKSIEDIARDELNMSVENARKALCHANCFTWVHEPTKWQQDEDGDVAYLENTIQEMHKERLAYEKDMRENYRL